LEKKYPINPQNTARISGSLSEDYPGELSDFHR